MHYIIQENVFREQNYELLRETLERFELPYTTVRIFPFVDKIVDLKNIPDEPYEINDLPELEINEKNIFVFGALKLARISKNKNWYPGSMMNENHDYLVYRDFYKDNLLNYDSEIYKFSDQLNWKVGEFKFIRPTKDTKAFTGKVFNEKDWNDFINHSLNNGHTSVLDQNTEIQVSTPKNIQKEIRFWVVDGKVISGSQYRLGGAVVYDECIDQDAYDYAQKMVDIFQLNEAFVIDICLTNNQWKIVECGCINCAGFYKVNMQKLITAIEDYFN